MAKTVTVKLPACVGPGEGGKKCGRPCTNRGDLCPSHMAQRARHGELTPLRGPHGRLTEGAPVPVSSVVSRATQRELRAAAKAAGSSVYGLVATILEDWAEKAAKARARE